MATVPGHPRPSSLWRLVFLKRNGNSGVPAKWKEGVEELAQDTFRQGKVERLKLTPEGRRQDLDMS